MVLIIKKMAGKKATLLFIPDQPLRTFFEVHIDRKGISNVAKTCIVASSNNWTGFPSHKEIVDLLTASLLHHAIRVGENHYPIPHRLFSHLKCRTFTDCVPYSAEYEGDFVINFIKIDLQKMSVIKRLRVYENISPAREKEIRNTIFQYQGFDSLIVYVAHHIHPAPRRA